MGPSLLAVFCLLMAELTGLGRLVGTVRDHETARPLSGAVIMLTDLDRQTATDADGGYVFQQVPTGAHAIQVRLLGYDEERLEVIVPPDGELVVHLALRPRPIEIQPVEVRGPIDVRGLAPGPSLPSPDRDISIAALRNHPLLTEADVFQALNGGEVTLQPETPDGLHIRGGAADQTAYLIDGIPVFNTFHASGMTSAWNPDVVSKLRLASTPRSLAAPHALSGSVEGVTRAPGGAFHALGSVSTTQTRLTVDGPLGRDGAGYLVSLRAGLPDAFAPGEHTYVRGGMNDGMVKFESTALGGRLRVLGFGSSNELDAAATTQGGPSPVLARAAARAADGDSAAARNRFDWDSRSFGVDWSRSLGEIELGLLTWSASGESGADWRREGSLIRMDAERHDLGFLATLDRRSANDVSHLALRYDRSRTSYVVESDVDAVGGGNEVATWRAGGTTPVATLIASDGRMVGGAASVRFGVSLAAHQGLVHVDPELGLERAFGGGVTVGAALGRTHQFAQSLRNAESVVGSIFPADLSLGSGHGGVPVARSDQVVVSADWQPNSRWHVGLEGYERVSGGLLLVAPVEGAPFATGAPATGSGHSRGASIDMGYTGGSVGFLAGYTWQRTRLRAATVEYTPGHATRHQIEGGVLLSPNPSWSVRLGAAAGLGRRATAIAGDFEWESCNLVDQGCEFGGSPDHTGQAPGGTRLPDYVRVDLGVRKRWVVGVGGRESTIAVFGTVTNLLNRRNVLTYMHDRTTGRPTRVEMRPLAPLVVGLDWKF